MLVVGDREAQRDEISVREHRAGDVGPSGVQEFAARLREQIERRSMR
ncbi:MAG: hypothetical protein ACRDMX_13115 [Solirubrobacteraceae bacterium]